MHYPDTFGRWNEFTRVDLQHNGLQISQLVQSQSDGSLRNRHQPRFKASPKAAGAQL